MKKPLTQEQRDRKNAALRAARKLKAKGKKPAVKPAVKPPVKPVATPRKPAVVSPVAKPGKIAQNGYTRPRPTNSEGKPKLTFRVWQIADEISAKNAAKAKAKGEKGKPATRAEVLAQCVKEKIKYSTFSNQFYRWRKFNGMFLRLRKDGTLSKPMGIQKGKRGKPQKPAVRKANKPPVKRTAVAKIKHVLAQKSAKPAVKKPAKPAAPAKPAVAVKPAIKPPVVAAPLPFPLPPVVTPPPVPVAFVGANGTPTPPVASV